MFLTSTTGVAVNEATALRGMFEARKRVFVDLLGWDVTVLAGRYEIDQFDDAHATYLILTDTDGGHRASARLLETERPHILDSIFPDLCVGTMPRGPKIREVTRFCLDRKLGARKRREARDALLIALVEHARDSGIESYTGVAERGWRNQILDFGWRCRPLGTPESDTGLGAVQIFIETDTLDRLSARGIRPVAPAERERRLHIA